MESTDNDLDAKSKSDSFCPHYERDTCLIHFKCCPEEDWYPCHKCHNEAVASRSNNKAQKNDQPPENTASSGDTAREVPEIDRQSSSENEISNKPEDVQMERGQPTVDRGEENFVLNQLSPSSAETKHEEPALDGGRVNCTDCSHDVQIAEETKHVELATALDGSRIKCTKCSREQKLSKQCENCGSEFASYFCPKCKLLIAKRVDAYHCEDCGICRANYADHFHCKECNVCMSQSLKENHKCFADRGHDPCAICFEEVFYGAIIFPCFHMVHKECAEKLVLSGGRTCPMCRGDIGNNGADKVAAENTPQESDSNGDLATAENTPQQSDSNGNLATAENTPQQSDSNGDLATAENTPQQSDSNGNLATAENTPQQSDSNGDLATAENTPQQTVPSNTSYVKSPFERVWTSAKSCLSKKSVGWLARQLTNKAPCRVNTHPAQSV